MGERLEKLKAMLKKEQERRIKLNNRIAILERRIQEESAAEVADMVRTANVTPEQLAILRGAGYSEMGKSGSVGGCRKPAAKSGKAPLPYPTIFFLLVRSRIFLRTAT